MNNKQQVDELLKQVLTMETQQAFEYLKQVNAETAVVNEVALLLKPSATRTAFLENQGLLNEALRTPETQDLSGTVIKNIKILEPLGQGGMGAVYLAEDTTLQRKVAVKTLHKSHLVSPLVQERFRREALILSQLDHPNICRIHQLIETEHSDFLVLELIQGTTLRKAPVKTFPKQRKFELAKELLKALKTAHSKNIVHRDLKPENIMLDPKGQVKVLDFGISRLSHKQSLPSEESRQKLDTGTNTIPGSVLGTLTYMSPEQAAGEEVTTASDIYTLGLVIQELFSETPVYESGLTAEQLLQFSTAAKTQTPQDLASDLTQLIQRMKSRSPAERPTAIEALALLEKIQQKPARRIKWVAALLILLLSALAVFKHISDLNYERQQAELARTQAEQVTGFLSSIFQVSNPYLKTAEDLTALELLDQGALRIDEELADQPEIQTIMKATIGDVFHVMGQMEQAKTLLSSAYEQIKQLPDVDNKNRSEVVIKYATLLMDLGEYEQAAQLFEEALQIIGDDESEAALQTQNWLVLIHNRLNQYDQGIALAQHIITTYEKHPDYDINVLLNAKNSLGMMQQGLEQYDAAEQNFSSALEQTEGRSDIEYSTEINLMANLAGIYFYTDRQQQSLELRKKVVAVSEAKLPDNHPDLIDNYDNLAVDYYFMEDLEQAKHWNRKSLEVFEYLTREKENQPDNFIYSYSMTLANYGVLLTRDDQYEEAKKVFRQVVNNLTKILGEQHKTVADYVFEVARAEYKTGEIDAALDHANQAIDIYASVEVPYSSRELKSWLLKAEILYHQQQKAAFEDLRATIEQRLQTLDPPNEKLNQLAADTFAKLTTAEQQL